MDQRTSTLIESELNAIIEAIEKPKMMKARRMVYLLVKQRYQLERQFALELDDTFNLIGQRAEQAFRGNLDYYLFGESFKEAGPQDAELAKRILNMLGKIGLINILKDQYKKFYTTVFQATYHTVSAGLGVTFNIPDKLARSVIEQGGKRVGLLDMSNMTKSHMFDLIKKGRSDGLGPDAIARSIRDEIPKGPWANSQIRSDIIAKTETKFAQNTSAIANYKASGVVTGLQAFDNLVGYNDEDCMARDGKVFSFEDAELETANEHPNGTLTWAPYTGDEL